MFQNSKKQPTRPHPVELQDRRPARTKALGRSLLLLLPLALLLFLLLPGTPADKNHTRTSPDRVLSKPSESMREATLPAQRRSAMPIPQAGDVWSFTGKVTGDEKGLSDAGIAVSRELGKMPEGQRHEIGTFLNLRTLQEGEHLNVSLPDGRTFDGRVNWSRRDKGYADAHQVSIGFTGDKGGLVAIHDGTTGLVRGRLLVEGDLKGWTLESGRNGGLWLVAHRRGDMVCETPVVLAAARSNPLPGDPLANGTGSATPILNSRPSATATLYIDFNGEPTMTYPDWPCGNPATPIRVPHSGLTADQMTTVWRRVSEDFIPFNINVSTQKSKYNAAEVGKRMRILVAGTLPPDVPAPAPPVCVGSAGLAILKSFQTNARSGLNVASDVPCWLSVSAYGSPATMSDDEFSSLASNISHEFGHTLGLDHDGAAGDSDGYYDGHGTEPFDWSPIMGSPYRPSGPGTTARAIIQWAVNDYPGADNSENDLAIIAGTINGFGYAADESTGWVTSTLTTATAPNQVGAEGVIATQEDFDWWKFTVRFAGSTTIEVAPADSGRSVPNLDCGFRVEDGIGNTVAGPFGPDDNLEAIATLNLAPGNYNVVAYGTGNKTWTTGGYDDYGSTGRYLVTINLPADTTDPVPTITAPAMGPLTTPTLQFAGTATDNDVVSALGIYLRRNADNAWWNGSSWQVGTALLNRNFNQATGQWSCTSPLPQVGGSAPGSLNAGSYDFITIAEDPAGHSKQATTTVTIDSAGPVVTVGSPAVTLSANGYAFTGSSQDSNGVQAVNCFIRRSSDGRYWNGSAWGVPAINLPTNHTSHTTGDLRPWTCVSPGLPQPGAQLTEGTYTFIAIATDPLGNHTQADSVVLIDDGLPPQIAVTAPGHNTFVSTLGSIGGTATDMSGIKDGKITFTLYQASTGNFWTGSTWSSTLTALTAPVTGNTWTYSSVPTGNHLSAGQYLISSNARDNAGTLSQTTAGVNQTSFRVDLDPPTVSILTPQDGAVITALPSVSGEAQDTNGIAAVRLYLYRFADGKFWDGSAWGGGGSAILPTQITGNSWASSPGSNLPQPGSNSNNNLTNGSYNLIAFAVDTAGNQTRTDAVITVELTYTWTGATLRDGIGNNDSNDWNTAANWSPLGVPGIEDKVVIANGDRVDSSISRTVLGLQLSSGMLNFTNGPGANGTLTTTNSSTWTGGTTTGTWDNQGTLTISGTQIKAIWNGCVINNFGQVTWTGPGLLRGDTNATWTNKPGSSFTIIGDGDVFANNGGGNVFNNEAGAKFIKLTGAGGNAFGYVDEWTFNNAGEIDCREGTLHFNTILNLQLGTTFAGAGRILLNGTTNLSTEVNSTGNPELVSLLNGNTVNAGFTGTNPFVWSSGLINGRFTLASGSVLDLTTSTSKAIGNSAIFTNKGRVNWKDEGRLRGDTNATFNNEAAAVFDAFTDGDIFSNNGGGNVFNNKTGAVFRKSGKSTTAGAVSFVDEWTFNNSGTIRTDDGVLQFNTVLNLNDGGLITHAGALEARVLSTHYFVLTGTTTINNVTFQSGGDWHGNTAPGTAGNGTLATLGGGVFEWSGGVAYNVVNLAPGSAFLMSGSAVKAIGNASVLKNYANATLTGSGDLRGDTNATLSNYGSFTTTSDANFVNNGGGNRFVNNSGATFRKTGSTGDNRFDWAFDNAGTVTGASGVIALNAGGTSSGTFVATSPGLLQFSGGQHDLITTARFEGTGRTQVVGGIVNAVNAVNADTTAGLLEITGGTVTSAPAGSFNALGNITWTGGTIAGTFNARAGSNFLLTGAAVRSIGQSSVINNSATAVYTGPGLLRGDTNATWNNKPGSSFSISADGDVLANNGGGNVFNNEAGATFAKTTGAGGNAFSLIDEWAFNNAGTITSQQGTLQFITTLSLNNLSSFAGAGRILLNGTTNLNTMLNSTGNPELIGTLNSAANAGFTGSAPLIWSNGLINGTFTLSAGSVLDLSTSSIKAIGNNAIFTNLGRVNWKSDGRLRGDTNAIFNNESGAIFEAFGDGDIFANNGGGNVFNNKSGATFHKSGGAAGSASSFVDEWTFNNASTIRCLQGTIHFNTTLNLNPGSTFAGPGRVLMNGLTNLNTVVTSTAEQELISTLNGNTADAGFTCTNPFVWSSGLINGRFTLASGSVLDLTTSTLKAIGNGAIFTNKGRVNWKDGGRLRGDTNATFNNEAAAVFDAFTDGDIFSNNGGGNVFNNKTGALFRKSGKSTTAGEVSLVDEWTFNNSGIIGADDGVLQFNTIFNLNDGGLITRAGALEARVLSTHYFVLTGTTTINNITFQSSGDWHGNTVPGTAGNGTIATVGGGVFEWSGGTAYNVVNIAPGATFNLTGGLKAIGNGSNLKNGGIATWTGGTLRGDTNATFSNLDGASFLAATDADFTNNGGGNLFSNSGTFNIGTPLGVTDMNWSYVQTSSGRLLVDIGGTNATTPQFDQMRINGSATLGGTVNVTKLNGYAPTDGTTFPFLTAGNVSGTFALVSGGFAGNYTSNSVTLRASSAGLTFDSWATSKGLTGANALPGADPDKDGYSNFFEYVHNMDPTTSSGPPDNSSITTIGGQQFLTLKYRRWADREAAGVTYTPETGTNLGNWGSAGIIEEVDPAAPVIPGSTACRCRVPVTPGQKKFLRVKAVKP